MATSAPPNSSTESVNVLMASEEEMQGVYASDLDFASIVCGRSQATATDLLHCDMESRKRTAIIQEGPDAARRFEDAVTRVLRVSKEELDRREADYQESSRAKPRRGPKPTERSTA